MSSNNRKSTNEKGSNNQPRNARTICHETGHVPCAACATNLNVVKNSYNIGRDYIANSELNAVPSRENLYNPSHPYWTLAQDAKKTSEAPALNELNTQIESVPSPKSRSGTLSPPCEQNVLNASLTMSTGSRLPPSAGNSVRNFNKDMRSKFPLNVLPAQDASRPAVSTAKKERIVISDDETDTILAASMAQQYQDYNLSDDEGAQVKRKESPPLDSPSEKRQYLDNSSHGFHAAPAKKKRVIYIDLEKDETPYDVLIAFREKQD